MDAQQGMEQRQPRRFARWLWLIIGLAVGLRVAAALYLGNTVEILPGTYDQVHYNNLALRVLGGHGFSFEWASWPMTAAGAPTAHWSFLYTLYLAGVYALFGPNPLVARLIQAVVVGVLHTAFAYLIGRRLFGERAGLWAAGFTAVYIYFVYYAATLMTEPFYITAIMGALYGLMRMRDVVSGRAMRLAVAVGLALGVAVLLRQLVLLLVPFLLLWLWVARYRDARRLALTSGLQPSPAITVGRFLKDAAAPWRSTLVVVGLIVLMILPFTIYNFGRFERFVLLNTNAGYAFFWANHPVYGTRFQGILPPEMGTYQDLIPQELRHLDEPALEQALLRRGLEFVVDDPGRYALLSLSRIPVYFMFWPSSGSGVVSNVSRVGSFGLFLPLMLAGLMLSLADGQVRRRSLGDGSLLLLFAVIYSAIHLLSWALVRYRLPVDAILLIYAGLAAEAVWVWLSARRSLLAKPEVA